MKFIPDFDFFCSGKKKIVKIKRQAISLATLKVSTRNHWPISNITIPTFPFCIVCHSSVSTSSFVTLSVKNIHVAELLWQPREYGKCGRSGLTTGSPSSFAPRTWRASRRVMECSWRGQSHYCASLTASYSLFLDAADLTCHLSLKYPGLLLLGRWLKLSPRKKMRFLLPLRGL